MPAVPDIRIVGADRPIVSQITQIEPRLNALACLLNLLDRARSWLAGRLCSRVKPFDAYRGGKLQ